MIYQFQPWKAVTEIIKGGRLYQRSGAWREGGKFGYHVSELYKPLYEQQFFIFFKGLFHSLYSLKSPAENR